MRPASGAHLDLPGRGETAACGRYGARRIALPVRPGKPEQATRAQLDGNQRRQRRRRNSFSRNLLQA